MADSSKRVGRHGSFKKKMSYIEKRTDRRKKEKTKLMSIKKIVDEIKILTRLPIAVMAYSNGKIIGHSSSKGLQKFLNDPVVVQKFKEFMLETEECEESIDNEIGTLGDVEKDIEMDDFFDFPSDWSSLNALKKRDLLCNLVTTSTGLGSKFKWDEANKPVWWPSIPFRTPHGNPKTGIDHLNLAIQSFHQFEVMNIVSSISKWDLHPPLDGDWSNLRAWCEEEWEKSSLAVDWLKQQTPSPTASQNSVSHKFRRYTRSFKPKEPFSYDSSLHCLSRIYFNTVVYWKFFKYVAFLYGVLNIDLLLNCMSNGINGATPNQVEKWFGGGGEQSLKKALIDHWINAKEFLGTYCTVMAVNVNATLCIEKCNVFVENLPTKPSLIEMLLLVETGEFCCMMEPEEPIDETNCTAHNMFCKRPHSDEPALVCKNCVLPYHYNCAMRVKDCGCFEVDALRNSVNQLCEDTQRFSSEFRKFKKSLLESNLQDVVSGKMFSLRSQLINRKLSTGACEELEKINRFTASLHDENIAIVRASIESLLGDQTIAAHLSNRYEPFQMATVVTDFLLPQILISFFKRALSGTDISELMVERATYVKD